MLGTYTSIDDRAALAAATGDHPWAMLSTRYRYGGGFTGRDLTLWHGGNDLRTSVGALGSGPAALDLVRLLVADGTLPSGTRAELPRMDHAPVLAAFPDVAVVDWDLRWLETPPPVVAGEDAVIALGEADFDEINEVLDGSLPDAHNRPGSARLNGWFGIRDEGRLVAVAADSSSPGFGFLNSIAVRPELYGRGLGTVLTSRLARDHYAEHGAALLGVWSHNVGASRLYHRLGYTGLSEMTSFTLP
jgi:GNAT superfamily N-acetyltransferase